MVCLMMESSRIGSFIIGILCLEITSAAVELQYGGVNERNNVRRDFHDLLETVARNEGNTSILRRFLKEDAAQDHVAFETLKHSLSMRAAKQIHPRRGVAAINKREAEEGKSDVSQNAAEGTTSHSAAEPEETKPSSTDVPTVTTPRSTVVTEETSSYSTVMPEELISKFDIFYKTIHDIKFDPRLSQWRSTTKSADSATATSLVNEKKEVSRRADTSPSVKPDQPSGTTLSETEEDLERYQTELLPEDTAPHLYHPPNPWTVPPRTRGFTGVYTRNQKYPQQQPFNNYTPPFNNEHYSNYQRMFHRPNAFSQTQSYASPSPPPPPRDWPQQPDQWPQSQNQQPPNDFWEQPAPQQGAQYGSYYSPQQGPYQGPPPQSPPAPQQPGQPPYPMQDRQFDQQPGMNQQFPQDPRYGQRQFPSPRRNYGRHYPNQNFEPQRNDTDANITPTSYRRRNFHQRRWYPRKQQYQRGQQHPWPSQYQTGAPPSHMQPPPPPHHQQMYPPAQPPPPRSWPNSPYYPQQQPYNNAPRDYQQPPSQNANRQPNPDWQSGQNQAPYMNDMHPSNYPPMDPKVNQQIRPKNNKQSPPPPPPPSPPPPSQPPPQ